MKSSIHPQDYRLVVFSDEQAGFAFLTRSTAQSTETIKWKDSQTYPLVKVHISSKSHPFFTGEEKIIDTEGRVDRFKPPRRPAVKLSSTKQKRLTPLLPPRLSKLPMTKPATTTLSQPKPPRKLRNRSTRKTRRHQLHNKTSLLSVGDVLFVEYFRVLCSLAE